MTYDFGAFNNWGTRKKVAVRSVASAFVPDEKIDAEWKDLNFHSRPDLENAKREYAVVENLLKSTGEGKIEGGDLVWIDRNTLLAGVGYRTNVEGVRQLQAICGPEVQVIWFDMPHYKGKSDVFHLMSCLSPLDKDLAVVYQPLMAGRLLEFLTSRGIKFVDVPERRRRPHMYDQAFGAGLN